MHAISDENKVPVEAQLTLQEIKKHGLPWKYVFDARLPELDRRLQVREVKSTILPRVVKRYKTAYERDDLVPPPVLTADKLLIDGANRVEGARAAGKVTLGMFRIEINYEAATSGQKLDLIALGTALNNMHGQGMTKADNAARIRDMSVDGKSAKDIAEDLHIDASEVASVLAETKATVRLTNMGIKPEGGIKPSHLREFGKKDKQVTDPVLRKIAELVRDTNMTVAETQQLFRDLSTEREEPHKMALLNRVAVEREPLRGAINIRRTGYSSKMGRAVGQVLAVRDNAEEAVERDARYMDDRARRLREAIGVLEKALHYQMEAQRALGVTDSPVPVPAFRTGR